MHAVISYNAGPRRGIAAECRCTRNPAHAISVQTASTLIPFPLTAMQPGSSAPPRYHGILMARSPMMQLAQDHRSLESLHNRRRDYGGNFAEMMQRVGGCFDVAREVLITVKRNILGSLKVSVSSYIRDYSRFPSSKKSSVFCKLQEPAPDKVTPTYTKRKRSIRFNLLKRSTWKKSRAILAGVSTYFPSRIYRGEPGIVFIAKEQVRTDPG